jgi:hypothetical protein
VAEHVVVVAHRTEQFPQVAEPTHLLLMGAGVAEHVVAAAIVVVVVVGIVVAAAAEDNDK